MTTSRALYFPYTDIHPVRLARALAFFSRIIVYRLPGGKVTSAIPGTHPHHNINPHQSPQSDRPGSTAAQALDQGLTFAEEQGFLERPEFNYFSSVAQFAANMAGLSRLADIYHDPESLALQKFYQPNNDESSESKLAATIRARAAGRTLAVDPRQTAQVCLALAQELDRQQQEVNDLLDTVEEHEHTLGEMIGVESDPELPDWPLPISGSVPADDGVQMINQRLMAWAHVYADMGPANVALLTDRIEVITALDLNLARRRPPLPSLDDRQTEALEQFVEITVPWYNDYLSFSEIDRQVSSSTLWSDFLTRVAGRSWGLHELGSLREEAAALSLAVGGPAIGSPQGPASRLTLTGYLLPGSHVQEAFPVAAGLSQQALNQEIFCGPIFVLRGPETR